MKKKTVNPAVKFLQENLVSIGIILLMVVTAVINPTFISASNLTTSCVSWVRCRLSRLA